MPQGSSDCCWSRRMAVVAVADPHPSIWVGDLWTAMRLFEAGIKVVTEYRDQFGLQDSIRGHNLRKLDPELHVIFLRKSNLKYGVRHTGGVFYL